MDTDTKVALISTLGAIVVAAIPVVIAHLRYKGLRITDEQQAMIRDVVIEGAKYAEEVSRGKPKTSGEKLAIATRYAQNLLAHHGMNIRSSMLQERVEAHLNDAFPGRDTKK